MHSLKDFQPRSRTKSSKTAMNSHTQQLTSHALPNDNERETQDDDPTNAGR